MTCKPSQNREGAGRLEGKGKKRKRAAASLFLSVSLSLCLCTAHPLTRALSAAHSNRIDGGMDGEQAADDRPARHGGDETSSDDRHSNSKAPGPLRQTQTQTADAHPGHADSARAQTSERDHTNQQPGPGVHGAGSDDAAAALALAGSEAAAPPDANSYATTTPAAAAALSDPLAAGAGERGEHSPTRTIARVPSSSMSRNAPTAGGGGSAAAASSGVGPVAAALPPQPAPQPVSRISHAATALMVAYDTVFGDEGKSDDEKEGRGRGRAAAAQSASPSQRLASAAHMRVGDIVLDSDERLCKVTDIGSDKVSDA